LLIFLAASSTVFAQAVPTIVRVEEDWSLNVSSPQQGICAPQLTTVISPSCDTNSIYGAFAINHRALPEFTAGGLQMQIWNNDSPEKYENFANDMMLNYREAQETITWTQSMSLEGGVLTFQILNGRSQTWGVFGGSDDLKASVNSTVSNLINYSPNVSVKNSGISYASNRVQSLTITKVRWITSTGQVYEDSTPKVVYPQSQSE
jgi:hypothetical protein